VRRVDAVEHVRVLVVVDEQVGAFALRDLANLRAGERGVEQHDLGSALGGREHRVKESPVVAGQDGHPVAGLQILARARRWPGRWSVGQALGRSRRRARAQGDPVTVADRADRHRTGEQAEALEGEQHPGNSMGQLGSHQAAAHAQRHVVGLIAETLGELSPGAEQSPDVDFYDRVLLTTDVTLCDLRGLAPPAPSGFRFV